MSEDNKQIKAKVIALPTKDSSVLHIGTKEVSDEPEYGYAPSWGFDVFDTNKNFQHRPHHLYLTLEYDKSNSVTHIKEGYLYDNKRNIINQCTGDKDEIKLLTSMNTRYSQIVATTDSSLNLPLISEDFLIKYCKVNGDIKEVMVELEEDSYAIGIKDFKEEGYWKIKTRKDNTCIIHPVVERLFTKDEMKEMSLRFFTKGVLTGRNNAIIPSKAYDEFYKEENL